MTPADPPDAPSRVRVRPLREPDLDAALPLFAGYQRFYGVKRPDGERNRAFFSRFLAPSDHGALLGGWRGGELVGFATLYWTFSSVRAAPVALLNDLYVDPSARASGAGRALIAASAAAARERGIEVLRWWTALDNRTAQRLYERFPAGRSAWFEYELAVEPGGATSPSQG